MKKLAVLTLVVLAITGCTKVEPGYVGIVVNNYGQQRGVEDFPLQTGRVFYNIFTEDVYKFPTFLQTVVWTADKAEGSPNDESIDFNSIEGETLDADITLSYALAGDYVPQLFVEFRKDINYITDVYMRAQIRDAFSQIGSQYPVMDILGPRKQEFQQDVLNLLNDELGPRGFVFDNVSFVGRPRVSERVQGAISAAVEATQKAIEQENRVREIEAQADQKIAAAVGDSTAVVMRAQAAATATMIRAQAEADANRLLRQSLNSQVVQWESIRKWNGVLPTVTGENVPMVNVNSGGN